jgi:hypothetical protein
MQVTDNIFIPDSEIEFQTVRASGPGGQNVNKVSTAVQLFFDIRASSLFLRLGVHSLLSSVHKLRECTFRKKNNLRTREV